MTNAAGSMSVPTATKKRTANRSRNGSSRRRASAAVGLSVTARPARKAASASGTPKNTEPAAATASPALTETIRKWSLWSRISVRTRGSSQATTIANTANAARPASTSAGSRSPPTPIETSTAAKTTPARSCITLQPSIERSVSGSVVRRLLRVMLTTTTLDDIAMPRPAISAPARPTPRSMKAALAIAVVISELHGNRPDQAAVLAPKPPSVDLDADLEEQQHDAYVSQQLETRVVGDEPGREG